MVLPTSYKHAVFKEAGGPLTVEQTPLVLPASGEVLVKVEACGVCFSDHIAQSYGMRGSFPIVPGHEIIGEVAAVGDDVSQWHIGDRIGGAWHGGHDGICSACRKGHYQMCNLGIINGVTKNGGYAEYCSLRAEAGVRIPAHVEASKYAPILCAGVTVFNSMRRMNVPPGSTVAIQGLGGLGHLAIQYANKFGYRVVALSRDSKKEKFVRELGAHEYIDGSRQNPAEELQKLGGASLIVATAPDAKVIPPLLKGLGILGKLLILAVPGEVAFDTRLMISRGLSVHAWPSGHAMDSEEAIQFTELEGIDCMVQTFPLEKANDAYDAMIQGTVRFRAVITMN
ncbi:alcohol dehydrogenase [Penicillium soppii]|uniref:alcohol dehydrogenase n=1 Tax=Penicillium soppii TaxID=69789 RepID=UPI00254902A3|nr:alcohol dehydrogenase [Penicillium soppii]KAJ5881393.1 alcohol dehydrogenase [Penicillium soppii]